VWQLSLTFDELRRLEAIQKLMIISGVNDYELYCSLYKLEHVNTRLDTFTYRNLYTKNIAIELLLAQTNCCHDENWNMFRNSELLRTLTYSAVLDAFKTLFCRTLFVTTNFI